MEQQRRLDRGETRAMSLQTHQPSVLGGLLAFDGLDALEAQARLDEEAEEFLCDELFAEHQETALPSLMGDDDDEEEDNDDDGAPDENQPPFLLKLYKISRTDLGVSPSTERGFKCVWKRWKAFKVSREEPELYDPEFGLGLYAHIRFTKEDGGDQFRYDEQLVNDFFDFLEAQEETSDLLTKATSFVHAHIKGEFFARLRAVGYRPPKVSIAKIGSSQKIKNIMQAARKHKAIKAWRDKTDILADIDEMISEWQIRTMITSAFAAEPHEAVAKLHPLTRIQFPPAFCCGMQTGRRGEENYKQKIVQRFLRRVKRLGLLPGTLCLHLITNQAKHNQVSRNEYTACAPHRDPLRDVMALHGVMWCFRFVVMKEPLPDFSDYNSCFDVPTYRQVKRIDNMDGDDYRDMWKPFFESADVIYPSSSAPT